MRSGWKSSRIGLTTLRMMCRKPSGPVCGGSGMLSVRPKAFGPPSSSGSPGTGVERPAVLVQRDKQRVGIVPVDVLGAVAVVAVGVDDGHLVHPVGPAQEFDHHGLDVDVAEAAGPMDDAHGMVARGAHQREALVDSFFQHGHADRLGPAGADEMGFGGDTPGVGNAEMNPLDVGEHHRIRLELDDALDVEEALLQNLVLGVEQPLLPFRVGRADGPVEGREEHQSDFVLSAQHRASPLMGTPRLTVS